MASACLQQFDATLEKLLSEKKNKITDLLELVEKKTTVKRVYIVKGLIGLFAVYMILGHFAALVCNTVGFVYPAYASIHAIESHNKDDDKKWLTYWVVFAMFSVIEFFSDIIFSWFPLYWLSKIVFLVWCFMPTANNGSIVVYNRFIRPVFLSNRQFVDSAVNQLSEGASNLVNKVRKDE